MPGPQAAWAPAAATLPATALAAQPPRAAPTATDASSQVATEGVAAAGAATGTPATAASTAASADLATTPAAPAAPAQPSPADGAATPAAATGTTAPAAATAPVAATPAATPAASSAEPGTASPDAAAPAATTDAAPAPAPTPTAPAGALQVGTVQHRVAAAAQGATPALSDQLATKLGEQLPALRAAGNGQHVLTLHVDPEHFGPVRVVAHISADAVRVELVGATDAARDALRQSLPDLRRDLAATGLSSDVSLGADGADGSGTPGGSADRRGLAGPARPAAPQPGATGLAGPHDSHATRSPATAGGLDLLV
ncbi:flagellar hook-length control protein FliK [Cellulomonas endometrii]|uniref:flagellar hook-length control protein FliK n=1 Tax=Cellulomonas endometrii TaxID=3036301 RepID=UPI0024AD6A65|nr:flagellar hook-length control protein FliK [Cellulomonas endometrii]